MKNYLISIIILAAAYLSMPPAYSQSDSDLVWIHSLDIWTELESLHLSPDGRHVLASGSGSIHYIDVETGETVDSIMHQGNIGGFSPDKRYFYTCTKWSGGTVVKKIDAETLEMVGSSGMIAPYMITGLGVFNDGRVIVSIAQGNNLYYILDGKNLTVLDSMPLQPPYNLGAADMGVYTEGNIAAIFQKGEDKTDPDRKKYYFDISLYDIKEKKYIKSLPESLTWTVYGMKFFPDGSRIAINNNYKLHIVDINTAMILDSINIATLDILFSNDRKAILFGTQNEGIKVLDINNFQNICNIDLPNNFIAGHEIITKNEQYIIAAYPADGILMKLKNCYFSTGIKVKDNEIDSILYPNPGTNVFIIKNNEIPDKAIPASISNSSGIVVLKKPISFVNGTGSFSAQGLTPGMYFISLFTPTKIYTFKFEVGR